MTTGLWVTFIIWALIFCAFIYLGYGKDFVVPSYLAIVTIIAAAGYTLGIGARGIKAIFYHLLN